MAMEVKLMSEEAQLPARKHPTDAGWDFYLQKDIYVPVGRPLKKVGTGVAILLPTGWGAHIKPRSSTHTEGIHIVGTIEPYTGEIFLDIWNLSHSAQRFYKGDRIAQFVPFWNGAGFTDTVVELSQNLIKHGPVTPEDRSWMLMQAMLQALTGCTEMNEVKKFSSVPLRGDNGHGSTGK